MKIKRFSLVNEGREVDVPVCAECGFSDDQDLKQGLVPCGWRWCLARNDWTRTMSLGCIAYSPVYEFPLELEGGS